MSASINTRVPARLPQRWIASCLAAALLGFSVALAALALPKGARADDARVEGAPLSLPAPPADYAVETKGAIVWTYPRSAASEVAALMTHTPPAWTAIMSDLGGDLPRDLVIRVGRNPEEMAALAPRGAPPPSYASGVAYPALGVVLLTLAAPDTWERPDMQSVLTHELSHIALFRAAGGNRVPRWFTEGLAIYHARENSLARTRTLWEAAAFGNLIPLERLSGAFPNNHHAVSLAYAQSADLVSYMRRGDDDGARFRALISRLREGEPFQGAISDAYDVPLGYLEREWRDSLHERYTAIPLLISGGGLWALAGLLLVFGYFRRRRNKEATFKRWAEEEAAIAKAELAAKEAASRSALREAVLEAPPGEPFVVLRPSDPDGPLPTIEHEGRNHTVH